MDYAAQRGSRIFVTSLMLFCVGLGLTAFSARNPVVGQLGAAVVEQLLYPFRTANNVVVSTFSNGWHGYVNLVGAQEENVKLRAQVKALQAKNVALHEVESENERLQKILNLSKRRERTGVVADVIGYDPSQWNQAITVNKGLAHGVKAGMGVVFADAVVGQVTTAATHSARVLLITDHASAVDAIVQASRVRGVVRGKGSQRCSLQFVERKEQVQEGSQVVTSGMDQVFPKGLVVGSIYSVRTGSEAMFHSIKIDPAVAFSKLETVFVITGEVSPAESSQESTATDQKEKEPKEGK